MKKFLKIIGYSFVAGIFFFGFSVDSNAQEACAVESMSFGGDATNWDINGEITHIKILTRNCDEGIRIAIKAFDGIKDDINIRPVFINGRPNLILPGSNGEIEMKVKVSDSGCYQKNNTDPTNGWKYRCINFLEVYNSSGTLIKTANGYNPKLTPTFVRLQDDAEKRVALREKGVLLGNCGAICGYGSSSPAEGGDGNWVFQLMIKGIVGGSSGESDCVLSSGEGVGDVSDVYFDKIEGDDIIGAPAKLNINTSNGCREKALVVKIFEKDIPDFVKDLENTDGKNYVYVESPLTGNLILNFKIDEDDCTYGTDPDCEVFVEIYEAGTQVFSSREWVDGSKVPPNSAEFKNKINFNKGVIGHDCGGLDSACSYGFNDWVFTGTNGKLLDENGVPSPPINIEKLRQSFDTNSPCYIKENGDLGNGKIANAYNGYYHSDCYELLAPIPGIGKEGTTPGRFAIQNISQYKLGDYINTLFQVAMGILMLLAVVMIIVAGVEYMTVESIFGKSRAKQRITGALTGLILGFGIFIILRTINPALLEVNFGKDVDTVVLGMVGDPAEMDAGLITGGSEGVVTNATATNVCNNRKSRGIFKSDNLKYSAITQTTNENRLSTLEGKDINLDTGNPKGTTKKNTVENGLSLKLLALDRLLKDKGITPRFTEVFGPASFAHGSPCHYYGTCIDLATGTSGANATYSVDDVEKIIRAADSVGLTAQFEFSKNQSPSNWKTMQDTLNARGIDKCMVLYVRHASNWHFSIYDKQDESIRLP